MAGEEQRQAGMRDWEEGRVTGPRPTNAWGQWRLKRPASMDLVQTCRLLGRGVARANTGLKKQFQGTVYVLTGKEFRGITFLIGAIRLFLLHTRGQSKL
jgi:hypothetical protein